MPRILTTAIGKPPPVCLDVLLWRYEALVDAGYPVDDALVLAERSDIDLHLACEMLARGASVAEAVGILV